MVDRRRGTESPSLPSPPPPISPPDGRVSTTIRRGHVPLNSSGQFFAVGGWGGLKGEGDDFRVRACSRSVRRMDAGIRIRMRRNGPRPFHPPTLSSILSLRPLSRFHDRLATIRRGTRREATSHGVILACHVCSTMRVPTVEWPVYNPTMARLGPRAFAFCHSSLLGEREKLEEGG